MSATGPDAAAGAVREAQVGTELHELQLYGDPTFIVSTAMATRD